MVCFLNLSLALVLSFHISVVHTVVIFPTNSEYGIFMAISVPIGLPHRNVFLSYNYEFNYYLPEHIYKFPPILMGPDFEDGYLTYPTNGRECTNCTVSTNSTRTKHHKSAKAKKIATTLAPERKKRELSLVSRKSFYIVLRDKLERLGYPAEDCLLRMICETNASSLGEINGVLGNIVHIIFTPSSSRDEQLPSIYHQAESDGLQDQCGSYIKECPHNIMDLISVDVESILKNMARRRK